MAFEMFFGDYLNNTIKVTLNDLISQTVKPVYVKTMHSRKPSNPQDFSQNEFEKFRKYFTQLLNP